MKHLFRRLNVLQLAIAVMVGSFMTPIIVQAAAGPFYGPVFLTDAGTTQTCLGMAPSGHVAPNTACLSTNGDSQTKAGALFVTQTLGSNCLWSGPKNWCVSNGDGSLDRGNGSGFLYFSGHYLGFDGNCYTANGNCLALSLSTNSTSPTFNAVTSTQFVGGNGNFADVRANTLNIGGAIAFNGGSLTNGGNTMDLFPNALTGGMRVVNSNYSLVNFSVDDAGDATVRGTLDAANINSGGTGNFNFVRGNAGMDSQFYDILGVPVIDSGRNATFQSLTLVGDLNIHHMNVDTIHFNQYAPGTIGPGGGFCDETAFFDGSSGSLQVGCTPSRLEWKKDVRPYDFDALAVLDQTRFAMYHYNGKHHTANDGPKTPLRIGIIANTTPAQIAGPQHDHFDYVQATAVDGAAIVELHRIVERQEASIESLRHELDALKARKKR